MIVGSRLPVSSPHMGCRNMWFKLHNASIEHFRKTNRKNSISKWIRLFDSIKNPISGFDDSMTSMDKYRKYLGKWIFIKFASEN